MQLIDEDCLAETTEFNDKFAAAAAARPDRAAGLDPAALALLRRNRLGDDKPPVRLAEARDAIIGGVPVRVFEPSPAPGVFLHIHGGGWAFGSADGQDDRLLRLARQSGLTVVSVDYRLAPEHPLADAAADCLAVASALIASSAGPLMIGGESAGAHLSVLTLLALGPRASAFRAAHLTFGVFDLGLTPSQRLFGNRRLLSNTASLRNTYEMVTPGLSPEERRDPAISPLYADLSGMPPARFVVGTEDPLLDDSRFMAARWPAQARLDIVAGAMHGFTLFPLTITAREADREAAYLRQADLRQADLRQADLRQADLRQADLRQADLRQAAGSEGEPPGASGSLRL